MDNGIWKNEILKAINEAYDGTGGMYLDPETNLVAELRALSGKQASTVLPGAGNSVANQIKHLLITVDAHEPQFAGGEPPDLDWGSEWAQVSLTDDEWQKMVNEYEATHVRFKTWISEPTVEEDKAFAAAAVMAASHMAYHAGQIRHAAAYAATNQGAIQ